MVDIEIALEAPKPFSVKLGEETYKVRPLKTSLGIALGNSVRNVKGDTDKLEKALSKIVNTIFGKEQGGKIIARLEDTDDLLDYPHIMKLVEKLVEASTANPTM